MWQYKFRLARSLKLLLWYQSAVAGCSCCWRHNEYDGVSHHRLTIVYSTVYSDAHQRKHQSSASLVFVRGIHRGPVNSPRKWPVTRKMLPFDDVIMMFSWWRIRTNLLNLVFTIGLIIFIKTWDFCILHPFEQIRKTTKQAVCRALFLVYTAWNLTLLTRGSTRIAREWGAHPCTDRPKPLASHQPIEW